MKEAIAALKAGDRNRAFSLLSRHLAAHPKDASAWLWMSEVVQQPAQQVDALQRALVLEPDHPRSTAIRQRLRALQATTQPQAAILDSPPPSPRSPAIREPDSPTDDLMAQLRGESLSGNRERQPGKLINTPDMPPDENEQTLPAAGSVSNDAVEQVLRELDTDPIESDPPALVSGRARIYNHPHIIEEDEAPLQSQALWEPSIEEANAFWAEDDILEEEATARAAEQPEEIAPAVTLGESIAPLSDPAVVVPPALQSLDDALTVDLATEGGAGGEARPARGSDQVPGWIWVIMALSLLLLGLFLLLVYFYSTGQL